MGSPRWGGYQRSLTGLLLVSRLPHFVCAEWEISDLLYVAALELPVLPGIAKYQ